MKNRKVFHGEAKTNKKRILSKFTFNLVLYAN